MSVSKSALLNQGKKIILASICNIRPEVPKHTRARRALESSDRRLRSKIIIIAVTTMMILFPTRTEGKALSRKEIIESVRDSLENLQLEYIDLLVIVIIINLQRHHDIPKGYPQE